MTDVLLRIGEFARLVKLPVRTVRYYGDIGLLPPTETDPATGYRRYGLDRVDRANRLLALKQLGLGLDEIAEVLDDRLSDEQFRSLLESHVVRLERDVQQATEQLDRVRAHLKRLIERAEGPMADITIKTTEPRTIAFVREQITGTDEISALFPRLFADVDAADGIDVAGSVYYEFARDGSFIDLEVALPVADDYEPSGAAQVRHLPAVEVATITHRGAFNRLDEAYTALLQWIEANGYEVSGPAYEWNHVCTPPVTQDDESYVTEVQMEVTQR